MVVNLSNPIHRKTGLELGVISRLMPFWRSTIPFIVTASRGDASSNEYGKNLQNVTYDNQQSGRLRGHQHDTIEMDHEAGDMKQAFQGRQLMNGKSGSEKSSQSSAPKSILKVKGNNGGRCGENGNKEDSSNGLSVSFRKGSTAPVSTTRHKSLDITPKMPTRSTSPTLPRPHE